MTRKEFRLVIKVDSGDDRDLDFLARAELTVDLFRCVYLGLTLSFVVHGFWGFGGVLRNILFHLIIVTVRLWPTSG
jgi:hypothetical protein